MSCTCQQCTQAKSHSSPNRSTNSQPLKKLHSLIQRIVFNLVHYRGRTTTGPTRGLACLGFHSLINVFNLCWFAFITYRAMRHSTVEFWAPYLVYGISIVMQNLNFRVNNLPHVLIFSHEHMLSFDPFQRSALKWGLQSEGKQLSSQAKAMQTSRNSPHI